MIDKQTVFLVVSNFDPVSQITSGQLRSMGANNVLTVNSGAKALHVLQNQRVDIVLSDWNIPDMSGLDLLKAVRADEKLSRLPFILMIYEAERQRIKEAIASGVSDLLVNPYTTAHLITRVEKALTFRPRSSPTVRAAPMAAQVQAAPPVVPPEPASPSARKSVRPTILIVDDMADNLLLLSDLFKDEYRVRVAHTGEKALAICQSNTPPDLVLLDIMMPGMDGFEVARCMREHTSSETIPVIFVTSVTGYGARRKGLELGAVDFVTKPIDPYVLKPRVRNFMRYVERHKKLQAEYDAMLELARQHENIELISLDDMKGPLGTTILTVVRDYIAHLEGSESGSLCTAMSQLIAQKESSNDPKDADVFDEELNITDETNAEGSAYKKSWLNSRLLSATSKNVGDDESVMEIPFIQLRPGMEIESVYVGNKPYVKHCIANQQIIDFIDTLSENTGSDPVINIRLSVK
ncbi:MAG: response regulator [Methylobacter sp.]|nr:MAG: response regulator [Methylobacter sp.]